MAVDGLKLAASDVVYSELGTPGFCSSKVNEPHNCEHAKRCPWFYRRLISSLFVILALLYLTHPSLLLERLLQRPRFVRNSTTTASQPEVLEVFQVYPPVAVNGSGSNGGDCKVLVMEHSFGYSYGKPFVGLLALSISPRCNASLTWRSVRKLHSANLRIQPCCYELYCYF